MKSCCKEIVTLNNSELAQHMHQGPYLKGKHINASINIFILERACEFACDALAKNTNVRLYFVHFSTSRSPAVHQVVCSCGEHVLRRETWGLGMETVHARRETRF